MAISVGEAWGMCGDNEFLPPEDETLYLGLGGTSLFTYEDMVRAVGEDQAPTSQGELEALLWSFDAEEV